MQEQVQQNNLVNALNRCAEKWLEQVEDLLRLDLSIVVAIKARQAKKTQGFLTTAYWLERGLQGEALRRGVMECMACGAKIQDAYRLFVLDEHPVLLCPQCTQAYEEELVQRQAEITGLLKKSVEDLLLISEHQPDDPQAAKNLNRTGKIAAQAGVLHLFPNLPLPSEEQVELTEEQKLNLLVAPPIQPTGSRIRPPVGPVLLPLDDPLWKQKGPLREKTPDSQSEIGGISPLGWEDWPDHADDAITNQEGESLPVREEIMVAPRKGEKDVNLWPILFLWIVILGICLIGFMVLK